MHNFVSPCFNKFLFVRNHPYLAHIVDKHRSRRASHFKVSKVLIKRNFIGTVSQSPLSLHHIIPCILLSNQGFALSLHIFVNVELTEQVRRIWEYSFHNIHQRQIPASDNNPEECISSHEKTLKPL